MKNENSKKTIEEKQSNTIAKLITIIDSLKSLSSRIHGKEQTPTAEYVSSDSIVDRSRLIDILSLEICNLVYELNNDLNDV